VCMQDIEILFKDYEHHGLFLTATDSNHLEIFSKILKYLLLYDIGIP